MLGLYVHTHWAYNHPYAARTWTLADWQGFLDGTAKLGYDLLMVWPLLDCMPPEPTASDREALGTLAQAIDIAHQAHGMRVAIVSCPNTIGNEQSPRYAYTQRPYFVCEKKVNPKAPEEVAAFLAGRRRQFALLAGADALAVIDSDPGGYIGSTRDEFVMLARGQAEVFREMNPEAEFIYWMLAGWENYNRFWERTLKDPEAAIPMWSDWTADEFPETLALMRRDIPEPWSALSLRAEHDQALASLGMTGKNLWFPYGVVEGEPVFPLMRFVPESIAGPLTPANLAQHPRGVMANAQTHCLQLPHLYLFAHLARGGSLATADYAHFADGLLPGLGETIASAWTALDSRDPDRQRSATQAIRAVAARPHAAGDLGGLLFGSPERFLADLAHNLDLRASLAILGQAIGSGADIAPALRTSLSVFRQYCDRTGFLDAYGGPLYSELNEPLAKLHDPGLDRVLQDFHRWQDPRVRNGIVPRLLEAMEACARRLT
jgi:hypothetical protein